jgi:hypothetical protein
MRLSVLVCAAFLGATQLSVSAPAQTSNTNASTTSAETLKSGPYRPDAMALAEAAMPAKLFDEMLIAMTARGLKDGLGETAGKLEEESPGIVEEISKEIRDATASVRGEMYRDTLGRYARLYSSSFTPDETRELSNFYLGSTGRRLIAAKYTGLVRAEIDYESATTTNDIKKLNGAASRDAMGEMGGDDAIELLKLSTLPSFQKLKALVPTINQLEASMANEENPELERAMSGAVRAVLRRRGLAD